MKVKINEALLRIFFKKVNSEAAFQIKLQFKDVPRAHLLTFDLPLLLLK